MEGAAPDLPCCERSCDDSDEHAELVARVKAIQRDKKGGSEWRWYIDSTGAYFLDPTNHTVTSLLGFLSYLDVEGIQLEERKVVPAEEVEAARARLSATTGLSILNNLPPSWRPVYAETQKFSYDPSKFDFLDSVRAMFDCPDDVPLSRLHEVKRAPEYEPCPPLRKGMQLAGIPLLREKVCHKSRKRNKRDWIATPAYAQFLETYRRFLREVVLPLYCGVEAPQGCDEDQFEAVVQTTPVLRVVMPSEHFATRPHKDAEYGHLPEELNFWVPLTPVWGSNSLFAEGFPGREDFRAFEGGAGDAIRFWGNQCAHYAEPNLTESTRVSFDFRVIPRSFWDAAEAAGSSAEAHAQRTFQHGGDLTIGSYYSAERANPSAESTGAVAENCPAASPHGFPQHSLLN